MIAARQRTFQTHEPPVLFRLPNLRKRTDADAVSPVETGSSLAESTLRIDSPQPFGDHTRHEATAVAESATRTSQASTVPVGVVGEDEGSSSAKSWMERVGSRLILFVTLIVIVSAAWITGRQMPASKPGSGSATEVAQAESHQDSAQGSVGESLANAGASLPTTPATDFSSLEPADAYPAPDQVAAIAEPSPVMAAKPVMSTSPTQPSDAAGVQGQTNAPMGSPTTVFNTVSMQSSNVSPGSSVNAANSPQNHDTTLDLNPPLPVPSSVPTPSQPLVDAAGQVGNAPPSNLQTGTPHELTLDPAVLVPWALEQTAPTKPVPSATPHPVVDWEQYLPSVGGTDDRSVRNVSATQPADAVMPAQQALYPAGVTANPYSR